MRRNKFALTLVLLIIVIGCTAAHAADKIKMGVLALKFEENKAKPTGASRLDIVKQFPTDEFEIHPILDLDAEPDPAATEIVSKVFGDAKPVDALSADALSDLDVIVSSREWFVRPETITAIHAAVSKGTGLLIQTPMGLRSPGLHEGKLLELHGMSQATYFYYASTHGKNTCKTTGDNPLYPADQVSEVPITGLNGLIGDFHGQGILEAPPVKDAFDPKQLVDLSHPPVFYAIYTAQVGQGRVIGFNWYLPVPPAQIEKVSPGGFCRKCAKWVAAGKHAAATQP